MYMVLHCIIKCFCCVVTYQTTFKNNVLSLSLTFLVLHTRAIQERAESVSKKIGEKLTPEIRNSLKNAVSLEEVEEVVGTDNTYNCIWGLTSYMFS